MYRVKLMWFSVPDVQPPTTATYTIDSRQYVTSRQPIQCSLLRSVRTHCLKQLTWLSYRNHAEVKAGIALPGGTPPQSYGTSLAIWDHTVLPATRHKWTRPAYSSRAGWYSIHLPRMDGRPSWSVVDLTAPRPGVELATFRRPTTARPRQM